MRYIEPDGVSTSNDTSSLPDEATASGRVTRRAASDPAGLRGWAPRSGPRSEGPSVRGGRRGTPLLGPPGRVPDRGPRERTGDGRAAVRRGSTDPPAPAGGHPT